MTDHLWDLSLVIACYNEEAFLREHVQQILEFLDETCWTFEIIFVDDQSVDDTRRIIDTIITDFSHIPIRKVYHSRNFGRGRTVSDGIQISRGKVVGYIDIDLEVQIQNIVPMILAIKHGADVALADRIYKIHPSSIHRHFLSAGYRLIRNAILGLPLGDTEAGYKFFKRDRILPVVEACQDPGWFWDTEIMVQAQLNGLKIVEIPCLFIRHPSKKSTVRILPDTLDYLIKLIRFRSVMKQFSKPGT